MVLRVYACPFHKMEIVDWGYTSLFWEAWEEKGGDGARGGGPAAEEHPGRIFLPGSARHLVSNGMGIDPDLCNFQEGCMLSLHKPCFV